MYMNMPKKSQILVSYVLKNDILKEFSAFWFLYLINLFLVLKKDF